MAVVPGIKLLGQAQQAEQVVVNLPYEVAQAMPAQPRHRSGITYAQQMTGLVVQMPQQQLVLDITEKTYRVGIVQEATLQHAKLLLVVDDYPILVFDTRGVGGRDEAFFRRTHTT